jgi:hypothetical protein
MDIHVTTRCAFCGNKYGLMYCEPMATHGDGWHFCKQRSCQSESYKRQAAYDMGVESEGYAAYVEAMRKLAFDNAESGMMNTPQKKGGGLTKFKGLEI